MEYDVLRVTLYLALFHLLQGLHIPLSEQLYTDTGIIRRDCITGGNKHRVSVTHTSRPFTTRHEKPSRKNRAETWICRIVSSYLARKELQFRCYKYIPVFITKNNEMERTYIMLEKDHILYQAPDIGGSFLVTCNRNETSADKEIFGTFHLNSSLYVIQPDVSGDTKAEGHVVLRVPDQKLIFESITPEGALPPAFRQNNADGQHDDRRSRREIEKYSVELLSVMDYKSYKFWYDMTSGVSRHSDTVQLVMQYVAYIVNSVDMRYKTVIGDNFLFEILSAGVYIADTPQSSPWSENNMEGDKVPSSATLDSFTQWIKEQTNMPQFDHAMGFTGYDIVSAGSGDSSGIAYTERLCTTDSTSLVEDRFNFITMTTAAHELGHSLGALHDGVGNGCNGNDNYIMASVNSVVNDPNIGQNLWKFSTCSVQEFKAYINKLVRSNNNCMLKTSSSSKVPTTPKPMAEAYPADDTCVYRFGEGSYVCRSIQDYNSICISMYCNQPGTSQCYSTVPAEGTPCGKGKWCEQGMCVTSVRAPNNNADNCALGDRQGLFDDTGKTCKQYISDEPGKCYGEYTGANCCESCNSKRTGDASCEFGDYGRSYCSTMSKSGCYNNEEYCCATCKQVKNSALPGCEYGDKISSGCRKEDCWRYSATDLDTCCETCFDPTKTVSTTTSTTTKLTTPTTITTTTTPTTTTKTTTTTTPTTTTTTPTTTTSKTTTTTTTKTTPTTITTTTKMTQPSTVTPESSTKVTQQTEITSTQTLVETQDWIFVVAGCLAGAVVVVVLVVIMCIFLKRRRAKRAAENGRKPSIDNAYDNIGFVSVFSEKPHHPPPRRGSQMSTQPSVTSSSANIQLSFNGDVPSEHVDGYMMPASMSVTTIDDVHYTAPNKPKLKPLVPPNKPKKKAFSAPRPSPDLSKRTSKPVHYKRASGMSNSSSETIDRDATLNSAVHSGIGGITIPDGYDSIGEIQKIPHSGRPSLPQNHPRSLTDIDSVKTNPEIENDRKTIDHTCDRLIKDERQNIKNISDDEKRKVLPSIPPRPIPRTKSKNKGQSNGTDSTDDRTDQEMVTDNETLSNGYEEVDHIKRLGDVIQSLRPPTKPVPRRQLSSLSSENEVPEVPMKQALRPPVKPRPPIKPVPRRRTSSTDKQGGLFNSAFDNNQLEIQI